MLVDFNFLIFKYNIKLTGILHIGAHLCEEIHEYEKYLSRDKIVWVDAMEKNIIKSKEMYPGVKIEQAVISDTRENVVFNVSNNGMSSSFLQFGTHLKNHPDVYYVEHFEATTVPITDVIKKYTDISFNFINLDIQGVELNALKGFGDYLNNVDYIYTEVNTEEVYKKGSLIGDIDKYLQQWGFKRVETQMTTANWGDAFYIKIK